LNRMSLGAGSPSGGVPNPLSLRGAFLLGWRFEAHSCCNGRRTQGSASLP
jgi:hypothetical protein